jgi:hypothetical protein
VLQDKIDNIQTKNFKKRDMKARLKQSKKLSKSTGVERNIHNMD